MKIPLNQFYSELESITKENIQIIQENYASLSFEELNQKPSPEKWSIGECLQHLVCYGNFYLPAMEKSLKNYKGNSSPNSDFKTGYFGNKFAEMLRYKEVGMKKMKAPKIEVLSFSEVDKNIIELFLHQQQRHLELLEKTKAVKMEKVKVPIALTKLIKTKIGDTLRFTIYHNQRHIIQSKNTYNQVFK